MWRVAAGRGGRYSDIFVREKFVSIGWTEIGDATRFDSREALLGCARIVFPDHTERQLQVGTSQIWRFIRELQIGDDVITYQPTDRSYHIGKIKSGARFQIGEIEEMEIRRDVEWQSTRGRDTLSQGAKNSLGAIQTLIRVPDQVAQELLGDTSSTLLTPTELSVGVDESSDPFADLAEVAVQRTQDRILALNWNQLQELVAALLRALGYRTIISPAGADRGRDIIASRDGFGFERPRIVVEVKHRRERMGAPEIRSFVGGRHTDDRGLYVSTGGFTQEARYEADRAATVTHLMDLDGLSRAVLEQYEHFDEAGKALLPLRRLYWPA